MLIIIYGDQNKWVGQMKFDIGSACTKIWSSVSVTVSGAVPRW